MSFSEFPGLSADLMHRVLSCAQEGEQPLRAVVFRAFGAGDVSTHLHPCFEYLRDCGVPVVVTTQAPNGHSTLTVNAPGRRLKDLGLAIPAHDMNIESITTKLAWLLAQNKDRAEISSIMLEDLHGEVTVRADRP